MQATEPGIQEPCPVWTVHTYWLLWGYVGALAWGLPACQVYQGGTVEALAKVEGECKNGTHECLH